MLRLRSDSGTLVDAALAIELAAGVGFIVTLESAGGSTRESTHRNSGYPIALELILRRSATVATDLVDCIVDSRVTRSMSDEARRVQPIDPFTYPVPLTADTDYSELRLALTRAQRDIASTAAKGGNNRKRIRMTFTAPAGSDLESVTAALGAEQAPRRDRKDIAAGLTAEDVRSALVEWDEIGREAFLARYGASPAAKFVIANPDGPDYDAKAILFACRVRKGLDGASSDFDGDINTVARPLTRLGFLVEDVSRRERASADEGIDDVLGEQAAIDLARRFAGSTDGAGYRAFRREQRTLRRALGLRRGSRPCALCGRVLPSDLLVAAHIKRRSDCSEGERVDIPHVAMIACALGCDVLFEHGYIHVSDTGHIDAADVLALPIEVRATVHALVGRRVEGYDGPSRTYFDWHRQTAAARSPS